MKRIYIGLFFKSFFTSISIIALVLMFPLLYFFAYMLIAGILSGEYVMLITVASWLIVAAIQVNLKGRESKYILPIIIVLCMILLIVFVNQLDFKVASLGTESMSEKERLSWNIWLIMIPNCIVCFYISLFFSEKISIKHLSNNTREQYTINIPVDDGVVYCIKTRPFSEVIGFLVVKKINDGECKIDIIMNDRYEKARKDYKIRKILEKLGELNYKKVIVNNDTYNYLEDSFDKYKIKSIENADDYMLEL